jgi:hypothetical protein
MGKNQGQIELIKIVAETGIFFAKCDESFDESERVYIDHYLDKLILNGSITQKQKTELLTNINSDITLSELVSKTNSLIIRTPAEERIPLLKTLSYFINGVIMADGVIHPKETKYYTEWKEMLRISDDTDITEYLV